MTLVKSLTATRKRISITHTFTNTTNTPWRWGQYVCLQTMQSKLEWYMAQREGSRLKW